MKTTATIMLLSALILGVCAGMWAETDAAPASITLTDEAGNVVNIQLPVRRIACLVPGVGETLAVLGAEVLIVARTSDVVYPERLLEIPVVGKTNAYNLELLLELDPDVVITRARLIKAEVLDQMRKAIDAPILQYRAANLQTSIPMIRDMGALVQMEAEAEEFASFLEEYDATIARRVTVIPAEGRTQVFFQSMGHMFWTGNRKSSGHARIVDAGGDNIASGEAAKVPKLSAEWVLERNPQMIIHSYSGARKANRVPTTEEMKAKYDEIGSTAGLKGVQAVTDGKVHVIDVRLITGPRAIIGKLYYATWISPSYFEDVDPSAVHAELLTRFYDESLEGAWVYPE